MIEENLVKFICANTWAQLIEIAVIHETPKSVYWQKKTDCFDKKYPERSCNRPTYKNSIVAIVDQSACGCKHTCKQPGGQAGKNHADGVAERNPIGRQSDRLAVGIAVGPYRHRLEYVKVTPEKNPTGN